MLAEGGEKKCLVRTPLHPHQDLGFRVQGLALASPFERQPETLLDLSLGRSEPTLGICEVACQQWQPRKGHCMHALAGSHQEPLWQLRITCTAMHSMSLSQCQAVSDHWQSHACLVTGYQLGKFDA